MTVCEVNNIFNLLFVTLMISDNKGYVMFYILLSDCPERFEDEQLISVVIILSVTSLGLES